MAKHTVVQDGKNLLMTQTGMKSCCADVPLTQTGNLVLHKRYQGSDHHTYTREHHSRHLEGDTLATACGHKAERITSRSYTLNDITLDSAEFSISPMFFQNLQITVCRGRCRVHIV